MARLKTSPPSLVQHFTPPTGYRGVFGWICGYSGDARFLNEATEHFTLETADQRAAQGRVALALMLDPGQPALAPVDVPGLLHLPWHKAGFLPFRLLHAKLAVLGFRDVSGEGRWAVRLVVSTGNWTRQTLEESLDLAWCATVESTELGQAGDELALRCADIKAAWSLFTELHALFDLRILDAGAKLAAGGPGADAAALAGWVASCVRRAGKSSRFFDNRKKSLLRQLPGLVKLHADDVKRNNLALGSGFFEAPPACTAPVVLDAIVAALTEAELLTKSPSVDIFVNPEACQAVALALPAFAVREGWHVRKAAAMEGLFGAAQRSLHAKFIFSASRRDGSESCLHPWVYLGSGNLTGPGFTSVMSSHGGNLEAGIVFAPGALTWDETPGRNAETAVIHRLPVQWKSHIDSASALHVGEGMPPAGAPFIAPPVAWLDWQVMENGGRLTPLPEAGAGWVVLNMEEVPCRQDPDGFVWEGELPRQVCLYWHDDTGEHRAFVPVMDQFGRLAATPLRALAFQDAWWALVSFPVAPSENPDDPDVAVQADQAGAGASGSEAGAYPIRQMMEMVERIAARQTEIKPPDWPVWCARLEQTLTRVSNSEVVEYFRGLKLKPLSVFRHAPFRPDYAENDSTKDGRIYNQMLDRLEEQWGTAQFTALGGHNDPQL
jgi:hypothetical protein